MARTRSEGPFVVDLDSFPLVRLCSPSASEFESVDVASFFGCVARALARRGPFVLLHDARDLPYVDEQRQLQFLETFARRSRAVALRTVAYAAVASSPLERGLITALSWTCKVPFPIRIFGAEPPARAFLLERYRQRSAQPAHWELG